MTTEQRKEDNILIAKFMGIDFSGFQTVTGWEPAKYHEYWEALMPVVEKIMDTEIPDGKYGNYVEFSITNHDNIGWIFWHKNIPGDQNQVQSYPLGGSRISRVYKAVVEFIKWYNSQAEYKR